MIHRATLSDGTQTLSQGVQNQRKRRRGEERKGEERQRRRRRRTTESNSTDMALLMEPGSEPLTEGEKADLEGIAAIKESAAREYKEEGNQFVKMGRKHYADAVDCYTKAIAQMGALPLSAPNPDASVLFANRAHVNLLLGNHRRALDDAEQAIRLSPSNVKVRYPSLTRQICCSGGGPPLMCAISCS
jgi:tetratricopeptide (TPR) repeat protein